MTKEKQTEEERLDEVFSGAGCLTGNNIAWLKRKAKEREELNRLSQGHSDQTDQNDRVHAMNY